MKETLSAALRNEAGALAGHIVDVQYARQPDLAGRYPGSARGKGIRDARHTFSVLADAVRCECPELFAGYVEWLRSVLASRGFRDADLGGFFEAADEALRERFEPEEYAFMGRYLRAAVERL